MPISCWRMVTVLYVPPFRNVISVAGQVQMPTSHVFDASLSVQDYLDRSGGTEAGR